MLLMKFSYKFLLTKTIFWTLLFSRIFYLQIKKFWILNKHVFCHFKIKLKILYFEINSIIKTKQKENLRIWNNLVNQLVNLITIVQLSSLIKQQTIKVCVNFKSKVKDYFNILLFQSLRIKGACSRWVAISSCGSCSW